MSNYADVVTNDKLSKLEKRIASEYRKAYIQMKAQAKEYTDTLKDRYDAQYKAYMSGAYTKQEFEAWYQTQLERGKGYDKMVSDLATTMVNANQTASAWINGDTPSIYALNANYQAYLFSQAYEGISFQIYDEQTVENLLALENHIKFKTVSVNPVRDYEWNSRQIRSALISGILQGNSIDEIASSFLGVMKRNEASAMRNARTAYTSAQNGGRIDTAYRAQEQGIEVKKKWLSAHDARTRVSHQFLDGQIREISEAFANGLMYPADPQGAPAEVYNCRCTIVYVLPDVNETESNEGYTAWINGQIKAVDHKQILTDEITSLTADKILADSAVNAYPVKTYSGIWKYDVTTADWEAKQASIALKQDYYDNEILKYMGLGDTAKVQALADKLNELHEFDVKGQEYYNLLKQRDDIVKQIKDKTLELQKLNGYNPMANPYSEERKNNALWAKSTKEADKVLRPVCADVWKKATQEERTAIYDYTWTYHPYNEVLRGIEYGQGGTSSGFKGVGNVKLNGGGRGLSINHMTDIISRSTYTEDIWVQRGSNYYGMDTFLGIDTSTLLHGTQAELESILLGKDDIIDYGFTSCGVAKGTGFTGNPIIFNIYAPSGTQMMYAEPFSKFGNGACSPYWDGISTQSSFGKESEIILQQGTRFRCTKVERKGTSGTIYIDLEVVGNETPQRYIP